MPVGTIITWPTANWQQDMKTVGENSDNYLECNGQAVSSGKYPKLASIMRNVPNYQGLFLRGYGNQSFAQLNGSLNGITNTTYSSNVIGVIQGDAIRNVIGTAVSSRYINGTHDFPGANTWGSTLTQGAIKITSWGIQPVFLGASDYYYTYAANSSNPYISYQYDGNFDIDISRVVPVSSENRPINTSVIYLIKAK